MATRDKRLVKMRQNPKTVRFAELRSVLEHHGFEAFPGSGDHWVFRHKPYGLRVVIDPRRPFVLDLYVKEALKAIETALVRAEDEATRAAEAENEGQGE